MNLPSILTDEQLYVIYATQFANIDVRLQDLVEAARGTSLVSQIIGDWKTADINKGRARLRLFKNQSAAIDQLTQDFLNADAQMTAALQNLQALPATISSVAGLINAAVGLGASLIDTAPKKA